MRKLRFASSAALAAAFLAAPAWADAVDDLAAALQDAAVRTPTGETVEVWGTVLDRDRLEACLETVEEADGWPVSWLVVQDRTLEWDLVMRLSRRDDGTMESPDPVFATARREWDDDADLETAYREAFGKKAPRERNRSLVVQSFSKKIVTTYVYATPKADAEKKGLMALLPDKSLLREAKSVDLGDGTMHTVALVLVEPRFVPSRCDTPEAVARGHTDEARVLLVLAGASALEGQLDVSDRFASADGAGPAVPRYACREGDDTADDGGASFVERFRGRPDLPLLVLDDRRPHGDGLVVEARARTSDAGEERVELGRIVGSGASARLLEAAGNRSSHDAHAHHPDGDHDATVRHRFENAGEWSKVFDDPERDAWQRPEEVIRLLDVRKGQTVADLGAGTGYFSVRLARAVGPQGKVLALDVEDSLVEWIAERAKREGVPWIEAVRTPADAPALEEGSVDLVLVVNTWHHIDDRVAYARNLARSLRPGGRVAVVDYREGELPVGPPPGHKLSPGKVIDEFEAGGFRVALRDEETLPYQFVIAFTPEASGSASQ